MLAFLTLVLLLPEAAAATTTTRIIVKREPGLTAGERADIRADADVRLLRTLRLPRTEVVTTTDPRDALAALRRDDDVVYAELDRVRTAQATDPRPDPLMSELWALDNADDIDINAVEAWGLATGDGQRVAVVDTGVNKNHPDLVDLDLGSQVTSGYSFVAPRGPDDYSDRDDEQSHGTHVTGTIAARRENGEGIAGVASDAKVMALRALTRVGSGPDSSVSGRDSDIAEAFRHAGDAGVPVVNASLGGPGASQTLRDAIAAYPNTLFVVAAANGSQDNDADPIYPCNTPEPNVLCVGASTRLDGIASFSNFGERSVDVFAPGENIHSTVGTDDYGDKDGTSMATAHVSATAALVLQARSTLTTKELKEVLLASAHMDSAPEPPFAESVSRGRLDAEAAVDMALAGAPTTPDADGDGWVNAADACPEARVPYPGDGCLSDHDLDGILDGIDNCDLDPDTDQTDLDRDGRGAPCDSTPRGHNNDGDHLWQIDDACPDVYGTLANGCPAPPPAPPPNRDGDARPDASDACPTEYAISKDGCPLPQVASLSGKVRKRGTKRSVTVKVRTTRLGTVRVTIERRESGRWVRVARARRVTVNNRVTVAATRLKRGRHRVRVSVYNNAGSGSPVMRRFRVR